MKNNRGFLLAESLVVSTFVLTVLIVLFIQFSNLTNNYKNSYNYNNVESVYNLGAVDQYIQNNQTEPLATYLDQLTAPYLVVYDDTGCNMDIGLIDNTFCENVVSEAGIKFLIYTSSNIELIQSYVKNNEDSVLTQDFRDFISRVEAVTVQNKGRLFAQFADGTYATVVIDKTTSESGGEKIVIRILDYSRSMAGLGELGFSEENYKKLLEMISVPNGIILVTGATGSGKSTTVYSILQFLNTSETNIITVEDPIEMDIKGINQVQTNSKIGLTFATALRSILRQDPNIIMIGEIRDTETAKIAVRASITGHLVLSTLHTNTALNTIERLIDMDVQKYLLASALEGVISQKLARKLCDKCKKLRPTSDYEKMVFKSVLGKEVNEIYDAEGCEHCHEGYKGRIAIHEVLKIDQEIRDALANDVNKEKIRELVYGRGNVITMLQDGLFKVLSGDTTFSEILKLIELEDDDAISGNSALKEAIMETKESLEIQSGNPTILNDTKNPTIYEEEVL